MIEIRKDDNETLDEVVGRNCTVHAEHLDKGLWSLQIIDNANNSLSLEVHGELIISDSPTRAAEQPREAADPKQTCPFCEGSGRIYSNMINYRCAICNGTGQV